MSSFFGCSCIVSVFLSRVLVVVFSFFVFRRACLFLCCSCIVFSSCCTSLRLMRLSFNCCAFFAMAIRFFVPTVAAIMMPCSVVNLLRSFGVETSAGMSPSRVRPLTSRGLP